MRVIVTLVRTTCLPAAERGFDGGAGHQQHIAQVKPINALHVEAATVAKWGITKLASQPVDGLERTNEARCVSQCADIVLHCGLKRLHRLGSVKIALRCSGEYNIKRRLCSVRDLLRSHPVGKLSCAATGATTEYESFRDGVTGKPISPVGAANNFPSRE